MRIAWLPPLSWLLFLIHTAVSITPDHYWTHVGKPGKEESFRGTMWPECRHQSSTESHQSNRYYRGFGKNNNPINVRCCHPNKRKGQSPRPCWQSKKQNWSQAKARCESLGSGWRLCTVDEVREDKVGGTGCSFDFKHMWTSTPCDVADVCTLTYGLYRDPECTMKLYSRSTYHVTDFCAMGRYNTCDGRRLTMKSFKRHRRYNEMCDARWQMREHTYTSDECVCQDLGFMKMCYAYSFDCCPPPTCDTFSCGDFATHKEAPSSNSYYDDDDKEAPSSNSYYDDDDKEAPSSISCYDDDGCNFETCCDYKCDTGIQQYTCSLGSLKSQPENIFCDAYDGCDYDTCCDLTCVGHVCGWGIPQENLHTIFCANDECEDEECCLTTNPFCDSWICQDGTQIVDAALEECFSGSCSEDLCCVPACPDTQPSPGFSCEFFRNFRTCQYGTESCCGEEHHSYEATCDFTTSTWLLRATEYCWLPPCYETKVVQYVNNYDATIGNRKEEFLQACNEEYAPTRCLDVRRGQLGTTIVEFAGEFTLAAMSVAMDASTDTASASARTVDASTSTEAIGDFGPLGVCTPYGAGRQNCGNCVVEPGEGCDDCNMNDYDACKMNCCPNL